MQFISGRKYVGADAVCLNTKSSIQEINHQPWYYDNGFRSYLITMIFTYFALRFNLIGGLWIYNNLGCILMSYDVFGWIFITLLYIKGYK